jgi:hypothetical protein
MPSTGPVTTSQNSQGLQTTYIVESFASMPSAPSGALDIQTDYTDGKYTLRYTLPGGALVAIQGSCSQEPLATHPMFQPGGKYPVTTEEWKNWKLWVANPHDPLLNPQGWMPDGTGPGGGGSDSSGSGVSEGMKKFYAYYNRGVEDYLLGTVVMKVTTDEINSPSLSMLGRLSTPSGAPALPDKRNWLLTGIDAEQQVGGGYKVVREYRASAAGGWDPLIYSHA